MRFEKRLISMKKTGHVSVYDTLYTMLRWFACLCCVILLCMNFVYTSRISYDGKELVTLSNQVSFNLVLFFLIVVLVSFCTFLAKGSAPIQTEKRTFTILTVLYLVMAIYLIAFIDPTLRADARYVFVAAQNMLNGNYSSFLKEQGGYLYMYPHQIGLMIYDIILLLICKSPVFNFLMNLLFVIGINYLTYRITDTVFHNQNVNILTILCTFAFLPQFFFIVFAYGLIPGFFFQTLAFYNAILYASDHRIRNLIGLVIGIAAAVVLKQNYLIGGIAILIYLVLECIHCKKHIRKTVLAVILVFASMMLPSRLLISVCEQITDTALDSGMPSILWIAMGTDVENRGARGQGWYDDSTALLYDAANWDSEVASALGNEKLATNIEKIKQNPVGAINFFAAKNISQWTDPLYQSIWSGPLESNGQFTHTKLLHSLYNDGLAESCVSVICKMLNLLLWPCICYFLFLCHRKTADWTLMYLYCIGGLIFHTFWEAKSQYIYPYVFCLIPFAMYALDQILSKISVFCQNLQKRAQIRH